MRQETVLGCLGPESMVSVFRRRAGPRRAGRVHSDAATIQRSSTITGDGHFVAMRAKYSHTARWAGGRCADVKTDTKGSVFTK